MTAKLNMLGHALVSCKKDGDDSIGCTNIEG
jgi:hypothetical protein